MLAGRPLASAGVVQERNFVTPNEQLPPTTADLNRMNNYTAVDPSQVFTMAGNQGPFPHHLVVRGEPPIPSEGLLAMLAYTSGIDPAFSDRVVNMTPIVGEFEGRILSVTLQRYVRSCSCPSEWQCYIWAIECHYQSHGACGNFSRTISYELTFLQPGS